MKQVLIILGALFFLSFLIPVGHSQTLGYTGACFKGIPYPSNTSLGIYSPFGVFEVEVTSDKDDIVVELILGGYMGNTIKTCYNINERDTFLIPFNAQINTLPIYLSCHRADSTTPPNTADGCWGRDGLLDLYALHSDINPQDTFEESLKPLLFPSNFTVASNTNLTGTLTTSSVITANIEKSYVNYKTDENVIVLAIAWFYVILGFFLIIRFALKYY